MYEYIKSIQYKNHCNDLKHILRAPLETTDFFSYNTNISG